MSSQLTALFFLSMAVLVLSQQLVEDEPSADKRVRSFAFAKRSPYRGFAFAKRSAESDEAEAEDLEKRSYRGFAFAKRSPYRAFAFAKRSPYLRQFAFAKRGFSSFA